MKEYLVVYERADDGGWGARSPDVEGVFALGTTREEVERRMVDLVSPVRSGPRPLLKSVHSGFSAPLW